MRQTSFSERIGRPVAFIYFRAVMAQGEVSQVSERTTHVMRELKAQGVACGSLPYRKEYSAQLDADGRRVVVENPAKMAAIARIKELHAQGKGIDHHGPAHRRGCAASEEVLELRRRAPGPHP